LVSLKTVSNVSRFKPALNSNRVLADLSRGSNSLNSDSVVIPDRCTRKHAFYLRKLTIMVIPAEQTKR